MNTALWIMQILLAIMFLMPGLMKLTSSKAKMIEKGQLEPNGNIVPIRLLGFAELLGSIGIIVPWYTGILPVLTPITAVCFSIVMVGAFAVHGKKKEYKVFPLLATLLMLSLIVAYFRFSAL